MHVYVQLWGHRGSNIEGLGEKERERRKRRRRERRKRRKRSRKRGRKEKQKPPSMVVHTRRQREVDL